jgi:ABC-2 type transport system permease protein
MHKGSSVDNIHKGIYFSYNRKNDFFHFPPLLIYTIFVIEFQIKRIMLVLLRKEFANFFSSAVGYIIVGIFLSLTGLFLWVFPGEYNILDSGYAQLNGLFSLAPWLYLFLIPAITMRLFAEEKRMGTIELIYTRPIGKLKIVAAKYVAGLLLVIISLIPTIIYFVSVSLMAEPVGNVDSGAFWGSFTGLIFLASVYVAIGIFTSACTNNQIIAFVFAVTLSFIFYFGFDLVASLSTSGTIQAFIASIGINSHYTAMSRGVIDSRDVIYFVCVIAVCFLFTRWIIRAK